MQKIHSKELLHAKLPPYPNKEGFRDKPFMGQE